MKVQDYNRRISKLRLEANYWQRVTEHRIQSALDRSYNDLTDLMALTKKDTPTYDFYKTRRKGIERILDTLSTDTRKGIVEGMFGTAHGVADGYSKATRKLMKDAGYSADLDKQFGTIPIESVGVVMSRVWDDGFSFSDRLWKMNSTSKAGVNQILASGIARGQSAVNMSKQLKQYLRDPSVHPGVSWTTGVKKSVTGRGTIHHNALRLARTEINNTYRETMARANARSPVTNGLKWNISASHPRQDVCDLWAFGDSFGMGEGVFPAQGIPIDHPHGLCFITDVLRRPEDWGKEKTAGEARPLSLGRAEKLLSNLSRGAVNAAYKHFKSNGGLIKKRGHIQDELLENPRTLNAASSKGGSYATQARDYACRLLIERKYTDGELVDLVLAKFPNVEGKTPFTRTQIVKMRRKLNQGVRPGFLKPETPIIEIKISQGAPAPKPITTTPKVTKTTGKGKGPLADADKLLDKFFDIKCYGDKFVLDYVRSSFKDAPSKLKFAISQTGKLEVAKSYRECSYYSPSRTDPKVNVRMTDRTGVNIRKSSRHEMGHHLYHNAKMNSDIEGDYLNEGQKRNFDIDKLKVARLADNVRLLKMVKELPGGWEDLEDEILHDFGGYEEVEHLIGDDRNWEDYFGTLTHNKMFDGHSESYYRAREKYGDIRSSEMFANLVDFYVEGGAKLDVLKKYSPNFYREFENILDGYLAEED